MIKIHPIYLKKARSANEMDKWIELLIGIILVIVPIFCSLKFLNWGIAAIHLLMGAVIVTAILVGILFIILGISDIKG